MLTFMREVPGLESAPSTQTAVGAGAAAAAAPHARAGAAASNTAGSSSTVLPLSAPDQATLGALAQQAAAPPGGVPPVDLITPV